MADKKPKRPRDPNQLAKLMVDIASGEESEPKDNGPAPLTPAERGKMGGEKGGKARAKAMTAEERSEIAKKAAKARWSR
jgi:hypothetical protein